MQKVPLLQLILTSFLISSVVEVGGKKQTLKLHCLNRFFNMNRAFSRKKDKTWMHTPEALSKHYIPYNAKFLGSTEVEQPKGTEVVRDAVRKLKFARHIKKSEGQKTPKVELQISIYGVKILDPKTKEVQHNCQLHRISFCADDKTDKRIFTFICKDSESNKHLCYVFDSEKCAEEITLTIGQAFDLAYRKFLESGGKDVETRKQIAGLQKRIQELETENTELKNKVQDLENQLRITQVHASPLLHIKCDNDEHMFQRPSTFFWCNSEDSPPCLDISSITLTPRSSPDSRLPSGLLIPPPSKSGLPKPTSEYSCPRPRAGSVTPKSPSTDIFDMVPFSPISPQSSTPTRNGTQPPPVPSRSTEIKRDLFGAEPFDPFSCGAGDFPPDIQSKLDEMQEGFKMGLTLEGTVFCLDPLDSRC
ncbi:PTB domain-containing engulfment adapter protein 1 isoform X2 [Aquila chrysaetos chrysaetos]|uniref:PTB domain-containing engulfment adapter protein 1 isoform X2 n=1 Tax=Aquila chrysaetos chrysaetos TaxID=223781 RepID=UPI001176BEA7|nr:PTB domain-containing engulfment adapter protein 1 isoform X2 [Aquila chrysaetos chrysaetos]